LYFDLFAKPCASKVTNVCGWSKLATEYLQQASLANEFFVPGFQRALLGDDAANFVSHKGS